VRQPQRKSAQVWHALSRVLFTVLLVRPRVYHDPLPLPSQRKLSLIFRARSDERLSWLRHHNSEQTICQNHCVANIAIVSCLDRHARPSRFAGQISVHTASSQLLPESAVVRSLAAAQYDLLCRAVDANPVRHRVSYRSIA